MCSICGIYAREGLGEKDHVKVLEMGKTMTHRGPDAQGVYVGTYGAMHHNRLAVVDLSRGAQPMTINHGGNAYTICYNGELYNTEDLRKKLLLEGAHFDGHSDTEVLLWSYILWGEECLQSLNGIYAFAIYDERRNCLFCARDRLGVKPFFFAWMGEKFLFASEMKALLKAGVKREIDHIGLWQLLFLSPVTLPGSGLFRHIHALLPGECCLVDAEGFRRYTYWQLKATPHKEGREETIAHTKYLLEDAIRRQLVSDVPLCCFLSGGLDSSIVSAVAAKAYRDKGQVLDTYSFTYEGNEYAPTLFQPNADDEYAVYMADYIGANHRVLLARSEDVAEALTEAVQKRDFPGQADIDSSLYFFCSQIKKRHTVALSGECADEIFGGYPWFYRPEMLYRDFFPWLHDPMARAGLFREEVVKAKEGYQYLSHLLRRQIETTPVLEGEGEQDRTARIATKLSTQFFMASLLERKDRMSMAHGLEVRVPFSDHRILEYVYNVPWRMKFESGVEKSLLRNAMADYLPDKILHRKKSPYPKTHNPVYETLVREMLLDRLAKKDSPLAHMLKKDALDHLMNGSDVTWLGQLMSRPQMLAWLLQFDFWLTEFEIKFV